jgi:hypothetical protein
LVEEYEALHQPEKAAKFQAELAESDTKNADISRK